jgi:site-specific DNA recombinase
MDDFVISMAMEQAGVQLVSCTEHIDNSAAGRFSHGLMALMANWYSDNLSEEIRTKILAKVKSGGTMGRAPLGYLNVRKVTDGREVRTVELDPDRAPLVSWAFEAYATGDWSLSELTLALQEKGLTTVPSAEFAEKPVPRATLHRLLRNRYLTGVVPYKGVNYPGNHPALVSEETFDAVQAVLSAHNLAGEKTRVHQHYLKGSVRCGKWGSRLCITKAVNRHGAEYLYFFCLGNYRRYTDCDQTAMPVEVVEAHVEAKWQTVAFNSEYATTFGELITQELTSKRKSQAQDRARATKRRAQLTEQQRKLLEAHYRGAVPIELLKEEQDRISAELNETARQLAAAEVKVEQLEAIVKKSLAFLTDCYSVYLSATPQMRRQLNQAVFEAFFVTSDGALTAKPTEWFQALLRTDALRASGRRRVFKVDPTLHDSREWADGIPKWLIATQQKARSVIASGLGLNKNYLAEEVVCDFRT